MLSYNDALVPRVRSAAIRFIFFYILNIYIIYKYFLYTQCLKIGKYGKYDYHGRVCS